MAATILIAQSVVIIGAAHWQHGFFNKEPWKQKTIARMDEFLVSIGYLEKAKP